MKKKLNIQEQNALRYGLNHPILPRQVQKDKIKVAVEQLVFKLKRNTDVSLNQEIKNDIKFLIKKFTDDANRACSSRVNQALHRNLSESHKLSGTDTIRFSARKTIWNC